MTEEFLFKLLAASSEHTESLKRDILLCKTREEHVRVTARANEAAALTESLKLFLTDDGKPEDAK